jgi:hypothetical protein
MVMIEKWEREYIQIKAEIEVERLLEVVGKMAKDIALRLEANNLECGERVRKNISAWFDAGHTAKGSVQ